MEIYKNCFENYEISNFGNVRRKLLGGGYSNVVGSIIKTGSTYRYFQLKRECRRINFYFHHLVAEFFIGERPENMVIDHIDRNSLNNHVDNLRYCSQKENTHNSKKYRDDIIETDLRLRRNIRAKDNYTCVCGLTLRKGSKTKHERSANHIKFIENQLLKKYFQKLKNNWLINKDEKRNTNFTTELTRHESNQI